MAKKRGGRFPLLIYSNLGRYWSRLGLYLMVVSGAVWLLAPHLLVPPLFRHSALLTLAVGGLILVYGRLTRKMAYVQCLPRHLRIQTPLYRLVVSYRRVRESRASQVRQVFDPQRNKIARRMWPSLYWGKTMVVVELKQYPIRKEWLRLVLDRHLFTPGSDGFAFMVEDWMGLSRQIDSFTTRQRPRNTG